MKKFVLIFAVSLLLTGCSFSKVNSVDYNNRIISMVNTASIAIEKTATIYNENIPDVVTEKNDIDIADMQIIFNEATAKFNSINPLIRLRSRNYEQELAVKTELARYHITGKNYLDMYSDMMEYYKKEAYKDDVSRVSEIDNELHIVYTSFIEANNDLVELLGTFVDATVSVEETAEESV